MSINKILGFINQVKQEVLKITWPSRKEIVVSTSMISVVVILASIFFLLLDMLIHNLIQIILNF